LYRPPSAYGPEHKQTSIFYETNFKQRRLRKVMVVVPVDLKMSTMKPLGASWLVGAYSYIKGKDSIVKNGFKAVGIT